MNSLNSNCERAEFSAIFDEYVKSDGKILNFSSISEICMSSHNNLEIITCLQFFSKLMKIHKTNSHPERFIGKSTILYDDNTQKLNKESLQRLWYIYKVNLHSNGISSSLSSSYFTFAVILDFLKSGLQESILFEVLDFLIHIPSTTLNYTPSLEKLLRIFSNVIISYVEKSKEMHVSNYRSVTLSYYLFTYSLVISFTLLLKAEYIKKMDEIFELLFLNDKISNFPIVYMKCKFLNRSEISTTTLSLILSVLFDSLEKLFSLFNLTFEPNDFEFKYEMTLLTCKISTHLNNVIFYNKL
jgi:hypothetical protein